MDPLPRLLTGLAGVPAIALLTESYLERRDHRRYPPTGRLVDVGGHRMHVRVMGEDRDGPTVILDAGMVSFSSNWAWVQPEVAKVARVVAYDRSGLGWSDARPGPHDAGTNAAELHDALGALGITGPYVLGAYHEGLLARREHALVVGRSIVEVVGVVRAGARLTQPQGTTLGGSVGS